MRCCALLLLLCMHACQHRSDAARLRRSLTDFAGMIHAVTGKSALDFNGYGNWCGVGGSGEPVDPIDRCCKTHDLCYDMVYADECQSSKHSEVVQTYATRYNWTFTEGHIKCHGTDICRMALCKCDTDASRCFAANLESYDNSHRSTMGKIVSGITDYIG